MKRMLVLLALALGAAGAFGANTFTWTGSAGDYRWSNTNNWQKGGAATDTLPAAGDTVYLHSLRGEITDPHAINVDVADVSVAKLVFGDENHTATAVSIEGLPLTLTAQYPLDAYASAQIANDLAFTYANDANVRHANSIVIRGNVTLSGNTFYIRHGLNKDAGNFSCYGSMTGPNTAISTVGSIHAYLYGRVTCKSVNGGYGSGNGYVHFYAKGNSCPSGKVQYYGGIYGESAFSLPTNLVMTWEGNGDYTWEKVTGEAYTFSTDQTIDRVSQPAPTLNQSGTIIRRSNVSGSDGATLTLRATASAVAYARFIGDFNLVYDPVSDDFTQTVMDLENTVSGRLVVRGGTFANAGTNAFLNLTRIAVENAGVLDISATNTATHVYNAVTVVTVGPKAKIRISAAEADPFNPTLATAVLAAGAKIDVCAGGTAAFKSLLHAGVPVAAGTYTADGADDTIAATWVAGAGRVTVASASGLTAWKTAASGDWSEASNWSGGVPGAGTDVFIAAEGGDYTVTMDTDVPSLGNVYLANDGAGTATLAVDATAQNASKKTIDVRTGGRLLVETGARLTHNGASAASTVAATPVYVGPGAEICVKGTLDLTNFTGSCYVDGTASSTGRIDVAGGTVNFYRKASCSYGVKVSPYGLFSMTNAAQFVWFTASNMNSAPAPVATYGGRVYMADDAVTLRGSAVTTNNRYFGTGEALIEGNASNRVDIFYYVAPNGARDTATVTYRDNAAWAESLDSFQVGSTAYATGILNFESRVSPRTGYRLQVATAAGSKGIVNVRNGTLRATGARGCSIGMADYSTGEVNVTTGATLAVDGNRNWAETYFGGLSVGFACDAGADNLAGRTRHGSLNNHGGTVTVGGNFPVTVGCGAAEGYVRQTSGAMTMPYDLCIALGGGYGEFDLSGGTVTVGTSSSAMNLCLGGDFTNRWTTSSYCIMNWPVRRHDADGRLTVSGGELQVWGNGRLGFDGDAVLTMVGTAGVVRIEKTLTCSNALAGAGTDTARMTSSTLRFVCGEAGVAPVYAKKAILTPGTRIAVDLTGYTAAKPRLKLLDCADITESIGPADVTIVDNRTVGEPLAARASIAHRADGLYVRIRSGLAVFVR